MSRAQTRTSDSRLLLILLSTALLIRLAWGLSRPGDDAAIDLLPDQRGYLETARNLLHGAGLWYVDERFGQAVYAVRTPGYPLFIAACGGSVRVVRVAQAVVDSSTALAIYLIACRLLLPPSRRDTQRGAGRVTLGEHDSSHGLLEIARSQRLAPLLAFALVAFNPFLVYFSALLLTETLYTALLAWAMVLLLLIPGRGWLWGVLLLALAIHVRPSGIGLPVVLGAAAVWMRGVMQRRAGSATITARVKSPRIFAHVTTAFGAAAVVTVLVLLPWAWRNERVLGRWVWSTSNDGITAYDGFHPGATGASDQSSVLRMPELSAMGELERSDYLAAAAKQFMRENPGRVIELTAAKISRTWSPVPLSAEFGTPLHRAVALLFSLPFDLLVIAGLFVGRLPRRMKVFLLLPALYFTAIHALSVGSLRYRVPAEPPLAVLAAAGAARLMGGATKTRKDDTPGASSSVG